MIFQKSLLSSLLVLALAGARVTYSSSVGSDGPSLSKQQLFDEWRIRFDKVYTTVEEQLLRAEIWIQNHERIEEHNLSSEKTYTLGHNEYSDMTETEFRQYFKLGEFSSNLGGTKHYLRSTPAFDTLDDEVSAKHRALRDSRLSLPDYVNWVQMGAVTPVKNQGSCGSCWAFSTTGALEGAKFLKTGELVALSEQNLLDCDHEDLACSGGLMDNAFKFDEKSGGLCSEVEYPYVAKKHPSCNTNCTDVPGSIVKTFIDVPPGDERALISAVAMQPVSIAISAGNFAFQFYKNGVIMDTSCGKHGEIDHGVLAVGYGTDLDKQQPYFLVKNSWGDTWGDDGYVKIGRNNTNKFGICSIMKLASFPIVE